MAYKKNDLIKTALQAIEKHKLFFIDDIIAYLPCSKATFYNHQLEQLKELKEKLEKNKIEVKVSLRSKWYKSDNATLQMALYKLLASDEERKCLSMQYIDHTSEGKKITGFDYTKPDDNSKYKANEETG